MNNDRILLSILRAWPTKYGEEIASSFTSSHCKFGNFIVNNVIYKWVVNKDEIEKMVRQKLRDLAIFPVADHIEDIISEAIDNIIAKYDIYYIMFGFDGNFEETKDGIIYYQKGMEKWEINYCSS